MRRRALAAAALVAALLLPGCAVASDPDWTPAGWAPDAVTTITAPAPIDASAIEALTGQRLRNDAVGLQARVMLLPGDGAFNRRVLGIVRDAVAARVAATRTPYAPEAFRSGTGLGDRACIAGSTTQPAIELLNAAETGPLGGGTAIVCDVVAATGTIFGQRIRSVTGDVSGARAESTTILYADVATDEVATASALWAEDAADPLRRAVAEMLRREAGALTLAPVAADEAAADAFAPLLDTTVPVSGGGLALTLPVGYADPAAGVAPLETARVVEVPAALATAHVSGLGATVLAASVAQAPFAAPDPVPAGREPVDCDLFPCVALTYDDGPAERTGDILDALAGRRAAATFFVLGDRARGWAAVLERAVEEGHMIGNHSRSHPNLAEIPLEEALAQLGDATAAIEARTGTAVTVFRPPYGALTDEVLAGAGMPAILWDVDTRDWQDPADDALIARAVDEPRPGSIVLQHDTHAVTARTAGTVYDGLRDRGFSLVTVAQLFGGELPASGAWRSAH